MKTFKQLFFIILSLGFLLCLVGCEREWNNPFDEKSGIDPESWAPINLTLTVNAAGSITLAWQQSFQNIEGFRIDRKKENEAWQTAIATVDKSQKTYTDEAVELTTIYTYRVYAYAGKNSSTHTEVGLGLPTVSTTEITSITANSATSGGNITSDGGFAVTNRGVVWNTSENPTISNNQGITSNGTGTGNFSSSLTALTYSTAYYVRAYATSSTGTAYGNQVQFTTSSFTCGSSFTDSRDGNSYTTVQIGNQCWMKENLKWLPSVSLSENGSNTSAFYYVNGYQGTSVSAAKATANYQTYGALYNWPAALNACPEGWHLPTDAEWTVLTTYVSSQPENLCNSNISWIAKSLAATTNWIANSGTCAVGNNLSTNNTTGFSGLPGGYRFTDGTFYSIGTYVGFWGSTETSSTTAWARTTGYSYANVHRTNDTKGLGFSVRCLRD